jgi:excisionase family DNA binding protein
MTEAGSDSTSVPALEPLLSVEEVCDLLRISESGVYRFIRRGELASVKVGGRTLFEPEVIREFIVERRRACNGADAAEEAA